MSGVAFGHWRRLRWRLCLYRTNEDVRIAAFHACRSIDSTVSQQILCKPVQQFPAEIGVCDFTSPELHDGLYAIPLLQEANCVIFLEVIVVVVSIGAEF